jgi:hypothetical protein
MQKKLCGNAAKVTHKAKGYIDFKLRKTYGNNGIHI